MNKLKKAIAIGTTVMTILWSIGIAGILPVNATTYIADGDLVKAAGSSAVYYIQGATKRVFPHANVYLSWGYAADFSGVKTVSASELSAYTDGNSMPFRDGSLFRGVGTGLQGYAKEAVYYIEDSKLRPVQSEQIYQALFKDALWSKVTWVPDDLLTKFTYPLGTMITTSSTHPNGSILQYTGTTQKYIITDGTKRAISDAAFVANRYLANNVITVSTDEAYADGSTITGVEAGLLTPGWTGVTGVTSALTASLASDNQVSATLPMGSSNVFLLKTKLTAGTTEATITGLTFKRSGVGATADWSGLYLYEGDTRLTTARTLSTDTQTVEFTALSIAVAANSSKLITLRGDVYCTAGCALHATASDQHVFSLTSMETTATVTGLPVSGNMMTIGSQTIGTATVAVGTTPTDPSVGALNAEIANFKVTNGSNNNDVTVDQVVLTFTGTVARGDLSNFKLYEDGTTSPVLATASSISSNDTLTLTLTTPFTILKGQNRNFALKADIVGRVAETIEFYIDEDSHLVVTDKQYGFGAKATNNFANANTTALTLKGGAITLADNGPVAGNIGKNQQDVVLTKASLTASRAVEVKKLDVTLCADLGTGVTFDNADGEVADLRIKDADTGTTLMSGTVDTTEIGNCTDADAADNPITYTLSDAFLLTAGVARHLSVTVDLAADTANHMTTAGLKLRANLDMVLRGTTIETVEIRETATTDYIYESDVVPTSITGENQTVVAASLTPTLASTPVSTTFVKGAVNVPSMGLILTASEAATVNLRRIKVLVYAEDDSTFGAADYLDPKLLITTLGLYEGDSTTPLATSNISYTAATDYGTADFTSLNVDILKGTNKKFTFKANLKDTLADTDTVDYYYIGVLDHEITAYADSNPLTITGDINTGIAPTVYITVNNGGTLTIAKDAASPADDIVIAGTSNVVMSKFKFTATNEDITVNKLRVDLASSTYARSLVNVKIAYTGGTGTQSFSGSYATFDSMNWLIKKGTSSVLTVSADLNTIDGGATSGDPIELGIACATAGNCSAQGASTFGDDANEFIVAGVAGGNVDGNTMYVRKTRPTVTLAANSVAAGTFIPDAVTEIGKFTVTSDVAADSEIAKLQWTLSTNGAAWKADLASTDFTVTDITSSSNDDLSDNTGITTAYTTSTGVFSISWADAYRPTVSNSQPRTYLLKVDTSSSDGSGLAVDSGITGTTTLQAYINTDVVDASGAAADFVWDDDINTTYATLNGYMIKNIDPLYSNVRSYRNN
ncbi:MAG: hypothetical protein PHF10_03385 [Patescibacteria group bacterium]|nr:hypothetical protein [Patescibacteria group bacterium]MDD5534766.1 hypothetical protein [Patescibacteria group bacterium]